MWLCFDRRSIAKKPLRSPARVALAISLVVLLTLSAQPLQFHAFAQSDLGRNAEAAFSAKADALLKSVRRAALADKADSGKEHAAEQEVAHLSRVAGVEREPDGTVNVSLTVNLSHESAAELRAAGFRVGARIGDVATVETEVDQLPQLAALPSVESLSVATYYYPTNEQARRSVKVDNLSGQRIMSQTGRGVVVGVIDTGIDYRHLDFTVPGSNGKQTRIKALLDMTVYGSSTPDPGWNYTLPGGTALIGRLYTEEHINQALEGATTIEQKDVSGHGTHVAGTAAGNGLAGPTPGIHAGMAPEADLVIVKANRQKDATASFRTSDTINAMRFIQQRAAELGKPFVINMSLGGHGGPHDGTGHDERVIDEIVSGAGRAVCVAAGNEGNKDIHAAGNVPAGGEIELKLDAKNFFASGTPTISPKFLDLYYSNADRFTVTVVKPDNVSQVGPVAYGNSNTADAVVDIQNVTDSQNGQHRIRIDFTDGAKDLGPNWTIKLQGTSVTGGGRFDAWIYDGAFTTYVDPSRRVSSPGTARGAITVGAYVTRSAAQTAGDSAVFTSPGPTADGRHKPEISAPGRYLYSAKSADSNYGSNPLNLSDNVHTASSGTSMATPVVTGAVALLLQANPSLTADSIKETLKNTAAHDSFTGASGWNNKLGFGKLDVSAAIVSSLSSASAPSTAKRIDDHDFFVRQHYLDFLAREPETAGLTGWKQVLERCGADRGCLDTQRVEVSAAFFRSEEFHLKGYFVYRFYKASLGRMPKYAEFVPDMQRVTGATNDEVFAKREQFTREWAERAEFKVKYSGLNNTAFVDRLLQTAGVQLPTRNELIADLDAGRKTRAAVVRTVVESNEVFKREYNGAFVAMQYFGYLRRDPEDAGYQGWLRVLNANPQDYRTMVWGFIYSPEYRSRFG